MPTAYLGDRGVVEVSGEQASEFLDRLVTCAIGPVAPGRAGFGALLTPQGKILTDFIVFAQDGPVGRRYLLDVPAAAAADFAKRLALYRLRAKLTVTDRSDALGIAVGWDDSAPPADVEASAPDPRLPALGWRAVVTKAAPADEAAYHAHRIRFGIPEAARDFALADAFPHEADMDQLGGVDFRKGCYVGQEVVSRMQHRGTARTRIVPVAYDGPPPAPGTEIRAGERAIGTICSGTGRAGLATIRIDRADEALAAGEELRAGDATLRLRRPDWVTFAFPGERASGAA